MMSFMQLTLILKADNADDDTHEQEPSCRVIEPPIAEAGAGEPGGDGGKEVVSAFAEIAPRNEAEDHDDEGQGEQPQNSLLTAGELDIADIVLAAVCQLALAELLSSEDGALIGADFLCIRGDKQCGGNIGNEPDDDGNDISGAHVDLNADVSRSGDRRAGGEGVDGGAENTGACAEQNRCRTDDRVKAGGHHGRCKQDVEADGLFAHTVGGTADGEHEHQNPYEDKLFAVQLAHEGLDAGLKSACACHDREERAEAEHEGDNVGRVSEAVDGSHKDIAGGCSDDFGGIAVSVGVGVARCYPCGY